MKITLELIKKAQKASKEVVPDDQGMFDPVPLEGMGGYYLAPVNALLSEKDTKVTILRIGGVKYLIYAHTNGDS